MKIFDFSEEKLFFFEPKIKSPKKYFLFGVRKFSWVFQKGKISRKCDCSGFRGDPGSPYPSAGLSKWAETPDFPVYGGFLYTAFGRPHGPEPTDPDARDPQLLPIERLWALGAKSTGKKTKRGHRGGIVDI